MGEIKNMAGKPAVITHCNNQEGAKIIKNILSTRFKVSDITILECRCLTAFYAGERGVLLSF